MKFSIIINVLNGEKYIEETISSVLAQTYYNFELIIVDNASTDQTRNLVKSFEDDRLIYKRLSETVPLGTSRNIALHIATGDAISFLDADDMYYSNRLEIYAKYLRRDTNIDILYSNSEIIDADSKHKRYLYRSKMPSGHLTTQLIEAYFLSLETVCFRTSALDGTAFNDEFGFIEEADFFIRLSDTSKIQYVNKTLAKWREHGGSLTALHPEKFYLEAELWQQFLSKNHRSFYLKYTQSIQHFINTQYVFKTRQEYFEGSSRKFSWIYSLFKRSRMKDYLQIALIIFLPKSILQKIYLNE